MQPNKSQRPLIHAAVFAMLFIMAAPLVFTAAYLLKQQFVKHGMLEKLETDMVKTYTFCNQDVEWLEQDEELRVYGKMFDVKCFKAGKDSLTVSGIFDKEEDALKHKIILLADDFSKKKDGNSSALLLSTLLPVFIHYTTFIGINYPGELMQPQAFVFYDEDILAQHYPVNIRPPR